MDGKTRWVTLIALVAIAALLATVAAAKAELDTGGQNGDYQETACIHLGAGGPNGALRDSGSVSGWSIDTSAGRLTLRGVKIIGDAETVDITVRLPASPAPVCGRRAASRQPAAATLRAPPARYTAAKPSSSTLRSSRRWDVPHAIVRDTATSWEHYRQLISELGEAIPPGLLIHAAGPRAERVRPNEVRHWR